MDRGCSGGPRSTALSVRPLHKALWSPIGRSAYSCLRFLPVFSILAMFWKGLFALLIGLAQLASAVNFDQCLASINNMTIDGKMDNHGRLLPPSTTNATAITYKLCVSQCGASQEPFQWTEFSQQFSSWLLPWLALVSQIPFGANDLMDNLESILLTVGSPTLAAYSLALTALNGRWIARRFSSYRYENVRSAVQILSSLQQSPLRIDTDDALLASLIILPQNDQWWTELVKSLRYPHTWSISAVANIGMVVIAFIFTLIDFFSRSPQETLQTNGGSIGALWLWLLPIVVGWLQLSPKCDSDHLKEAIEGANTLAYVANTSTGPPNTAATQKHAVGFDNSTEDNAREHERITAPICNYARVLPWTQAVTMVSDKFDHVYYRNQCDEEIAPGITWRNRKSGGWSQLTAKQVTDYCEPIPGRGGRLEWRVDGSVWSRMLQASALAVILQWGTTGAAIIFVWFTPTIGLGCRSLSYLAYGVLSTLAWVMFLTSSILVFHSTATPARPFPGYFLHTSRSRATRHLAIVLRRVGFAIAALNTTWIVIASILQFSGVFDNCFCNSSVFGLRDSAYNVIALTPADVAKVKQTWGGGIALAAGTASFFAGSIWLLLNPALPP